LPIVYKIDTTALTDTTVVAAIADKPTGDIVFIRRLTLYSMKKIDFARWLAFLDTPTGEITIPIVKKILPCVHAFGAVLWEGRVEWPENYRLWFRTKTQEATNRIIFFVDYDVVAREPEKKGWGQ